jgi:hypothetical protein
MRKSLKINDSTPDVSAGSRADLYWQRSVIFPYYKKLRPGMDLPGMLKGDNNLDYINRKYNIKAVGFGNWVSTEDRHNYINSLLISLFDLNKILQFKGNIGIDNTLSIAFGARGMGGALAHFEPSTHIINITRYQRGDDAKIVRFLGTGGIHSFVHEYGHFLDYFSGEFIDKDNTYFALTGGKLTATRRFDVKGPLRSTVENILQGLFWSDYLKKHSPFYTRLKDYVDKTKNFGDYFIQRNEIFARAWEVYIKYELDAHGITNYFLSKPKYRAEVYPKLSEIKPLVPLFRSLVTGIREKIS